MHIEIYKPKYYVSNNLKMYSLHQERIEVQEEQIRRQEGQLQSKEEEITRLKLLVAQLSLQQEKP